MNAPEAAEATVDRAAEFAWPHWSTVRKVALGLYFVALLVWSSQYGIPTQRELVVLWTCGALVCVSLGRHPREILQIVIDWAPLVLILAAYDLTRGVADSMGIDAHRQTMIDFDSFVFGGQTPTEWIQAQIYDPAVNWYDVAFSIIYTSYFIVPFAVAGVFWARDRIEFHKFTRRLITLALAGLATYILFPAAPPWMAGQEGLLEGVHRTTSEGFQALGVATAGLFSKGQESVNLVAAVPSLHAGFTMLVAMFLWGRVPAGWRPLVAAYPVAMALTLVATGEHYVFDVLLGWTYAGAVMVAWAAVDRRRNSLSDGGASIAVP